MKKAFGTFQVRANLPRSLAALRELAYNFFWSWDHEAIDLFRRLDRELWYSSGHNPVKMLGVIRQERLESVAEDEAYMAQLERVRMNELPAVIPPVEIFEPLLVE